MPTKQEENGRKKPGPKPRDAETVRSERMLVCLTPAERDAVDAAAEASGKSVSSIIRHALIRDGVLQE